MKVRELVEQLSKADPDAMVLVDGYEDGQDQLAEVLLGFTAMPNPSAEGRSYYGAWYVTNTADGTPCVYLPRTSH